MTSAITIASAIFAIHDLIPNASAKISTSAIAVALDPDINIDITIALDIVRAIAGGNTIALNIDINVVMDSSINRAKSIGYHSLSQKLEILKSRIPSNKVASREWREFSSQLIEIYLDFFKLDRSLITFSRTEAEALAKYLYSVKLIIDCKNAAVRVSRQEWEAIESRLLTPQSVPNEE